MAAKPTKPRGLGRGLSALMSDVDVPDSSGAAVASERNVPIDHITPNPDQPRRTFDDAALQELAASIGEKGVIQPLIVRPDPTDPSRYQLVAGERRWRAAQRAKLHDVPIVIRELTDVEVIEIAIIENIQRADLNPIDEANGYHQLSEKYGHTQEQLSQSLGKSRSHIANTLRLLSLPDGVQSHLREGKLSAGHARTLVGNPDAAQLAAEIIKKGLSVRAAEALARRSKDAPKQPKPPRQEKDSDTRLIEAELSAHLGMRVDITHNAGEESGTLSLKYKSLAQLDDLLRHLSRD